MMCHSSLLSRFGLVTIASLLISACGGGGGGGSTSPGPCAPTAAAVNGGSNGVLGGPVISTTTLTPAGSTTTATANRQGALGLAVNPETPGVSTGSPGSVGSKAQGTAGHLLQVGGTITGVVTNTRGGTNLPGVTITVNNAGTTTTVGMTTTTASGAYTFLPPNPGTFDLLASATGMAASKFQGVTTVANQTTTANIIMFPPFDPSKPPAAAPTITVTNLPAAVTGTVVFTVSVATAAANLPVRRIDVRASNFNALVGATGAISPGEAVDVSSSTFSLTSTALANGPAFVDIITYDSNQNSAELVMNFTVSNGVSGSPPSTPTGLTLAAVTTGQTLSLFSTQRAQLFTRLGINQNPQILRVRNRSINLQAAPSNSTLFVEASWNSVAGAAGYKVYRSTSSLGPFALVAQVAQSSAPFYDDADSSLQPNVPVNYEVSAFNAGGESAVSASVSVTPLSSFNLNLSSPSNNATGMATTPTLTWTLTNSVGLDQFYDILVQGLNDPPACAAWVTTGFAIADTSFIVYGTRPTCLVCPLQNGKVYQWDIYEALAQTMYSANSVAFAVANGGGLVPTAPAGGSLNGPFKFTTAP